MNIFFILKKHRILLFLAEYLGYFGIKFCNVEKKRFWETFPPRFQMIPALLHFKSFPLSLNSFRYAKWNKSFSIIILLLPTRVICSFSVTLSEQLNQRSNCIKQYEKKRRNSQTGKQCDSQLNFCSFVCFF